MADDRILATKAESVFDFDKRIRFIALLTADGDIIGEVFRPGVASLEPDSETRMVYTKAIIALGMTSTMDKYHGRVKSAVMNREKVVMMMYNFGSKLMLVSAEPGFEKVEELGRLIQKVGMV